VNPVLVVFLVASIAVLATLLVVIRAAAGPKAALPTNTEWIDELSVDRYRPMLRLLEKNDFDFMRSQPGATPQMLAKMRRQRCEIFRGYLRSLNSEFGRVCAAIRLLMLQSQQDRPDLASVLLRSQVRFAWGIVGIQLRLALYQYGMATPDTADVLKIFDGLRLELQSLIPATEGAKA
jgi:hypothetical protein